MAVNLPLKVVVTNSLKQHPQCIANDGPSPGIDKPQAGDSNAPEVNEVS